MSFDQDPNESVTISGSDFAEMCDEIKRLTDNQNYLIDVLDQASKAFAGIESYCNEQGAHGTAKINGEYKQMCLEAISKARGNV